jgi:replicative DNA helicase
MAKKTTKKEELCLLNSRIRESDLPHCEAVEVQIIGAMMLSADALKNVIARLESPEWKATICLSGEPSDAFFNVKHKMIYEAMAMLFRAGNGVNIVAVTEQLKKNGTLEKAGGSFYVSEICLKTSTYAHLHDHLNLLLEYHIRRSLIMLSTQITQKSLCDDVDALELIVDTQSDYQTILRAIKTGSELAGKELQISALERLEKMRKGNIIKSGFPVLDNNIGGFLAGNYILIGARPSLGKTSLALCMAINMINAGKKVCFFSLEMGIEEIWLRIASIYTNIPLRQLRNNPKIAELQVVQELKEWLGDSFIFDFDVKLDELTLQSKMKYYREKYGINCAIVDYLSLMQCSVRTSTTNESLERISRSIKLTAKENDIPIIVLAQLNREVTKRKDGVPCLADLRGSGAMEQDADIVLFLHRPTLKDSSDSGDITETTSSETLLIIEKNRMGVTGYIEDGVRFVNHLAKFESIKKEVTTPPAPPQTEDIPF